MKLSINGARAFSGASDVLGQAAGMIAVLRVGFDQSVLAGADPKTTSGEGFDAGLDALNPAILAAALGGVETLLTLSSELLTTEGSRHGK
ncbi:MAG: hypothetical protein COC10_08185 [Sphingobium sp.]|nr:MAG: hypothetical protein COC10_08185 [Sphingobium sp.]